MRASTSRVLFEAAVMVVDAVAVVDVMDIFWGFFVGRGTGTGTGKEECGPRNPRTPSSTNAMIFKSLSILLSLLCMVTLVDDDRGGGDRIAEGGRPTDQISSSCRSMLGIPFLIG